MLKINSIFGPTIQGEGPSQGQRVMFLRLSYCNLSCTWCDTKYTWDWKQFDKSKEVHEFSNREICEKLVNECHAVVVSGGEPLLQQNALLPVLASLAMRNYWIEVETNGTVKPNDEFLSLVSQINCSPKLSNSGDSATRRIKRNALESLVASKKVFFKFVVGCEKDIEEVWEYVKTYLIPTNRVYLMPLGKTRGELALTTGMVKELADTHGFVFSSRLHVELWGTARDV